MTDYRQINNYKEINTMILVNYKDCCGIFLIYLLIMLYCSQYLITSISNIFTIFDDEYIEYTYDIRWRIYQIDHDTSISTRVAFILRVSCSITVCYQIIRFQDRSTIKSLFTLAYSLLTTLRRIPRSVSFGRPCLPKFLDILAMLYVLCPSIMISASHEGCQETFHMYLPIT